MLIINLSGLVLIALIVWWFWLYKPEKTALMTGLIPITVENGVYHPAKIRVPAGEKITLSFLRQDSSPCSSIVRFENLELSEELPYNQPKEITLEALAPGSYPFSCQMQMYRGELVVEESSDA
jgi:plastocyanin domain-containing protein